MNFLPKEIENMILAYKRKVEVAEHRQKFISSLNKIDDIDYKILKPDIMVLSQSVRCQDGTRTLANYTNGNLWLCHQGVRYEEIIITGKNEIQRY